MARFRNLSINVFLIYASLPPHNSYSQHNECYGKLTDITEIAILSTQLLCSLHIRCTNVEQITGCGGINTRC